MNLPQPATVSRVACVGTGTIGAGWASMFLSQGLTVVACDPVDGAEDRLRALVARAWPSLEALGLGADADPSRLRGRTGEPLYKLMMMPPIGHDPVARVTVCDLDGKIRARFGGSNPILRGNFVAPHGIWADSRGDLYVGEVVKAAGAIERFARLTPRSFRKFVHAC